MRARSITIYAKPPTWTPISTQNSESTINPQPVKKLSPAEVSKLFEDFGPLDEKNFKEDFSGDFQSTCIGSLDNCSTAAPSRSVSMNTSQISTTSNQIFEEEKVKKTFRGMIIGSRGAGKHSLVNAICPEQDVNEVKLSVRQEFDLVTRREETEEAVNNYRFWLKETQTKENYQPMIDTYYKSCSVFFLVYDVNNRASFESLEEEITKIRRVNLDKKIQLVLVGNNKSSTGTREVETEEAVSFKESNDMQLFSEIGMSSEGNAFENIKEVVQSLLK